MMLYGSALLLFTASPQNMMDDFLSWMDTVYQQQQLTHTKSYKHILKNMIEYNNEYNKSNKDMYDERKKEYHDGYIIWNVERIVKDGKSCWRKNIWEDRKGQLIPWQHPFHFLYLNMLEVNTGLE